MKILVLGSEGLIGRALVEHLKLEHEVYEFDNFSNPITDLRINGILDGLLPHIDFVFFLAFDVGGATYLKTYQNTYGFISNNIKIMNNTFDSLKKSDTPFLFTSSQMAEMSHSSYGLLKAIGEKYTYNLNGKIVKLWNVYGDEYNFEKLHVISDFILSASTRGAIHMETTGEESRQFLYVEDCCKCLSILMNQFNTIHQNKFDVSSFQWTTIREVAEIIASNFSDCAIYPGNAIDDVQRDSLNEPTREILKYWQPETTIDMGIKNIINKRW